MDWFYSQFCEAQFLCYQGEPNWVGWLVLLAVPTYLLFKTGVLELVAVLVVVIVQSIYESIGDLITGIPETYRAVFSNSDRYADRKFTGRLRKPMGVALKIFHFTWLTLGLVGGAVGVLSLFREWYLTGQFPDI